MGEQPEPEIVLVGLDFETTGVDTDTLLPIQVGVACVHDSLPGGTLCHEWDVKWPLNHKNVPYIEDGALEVNGFTYDRIFRHGTMYPEVVTELLWWVGGLVSMLPDNVELIPVGWNVGGFDMRIMKVFFPNAKAYFSHRTREINTGVALLEKASGIPYSEAKTRIKVLGEALAREHLPEGQAHTALFDALASIYAWQKIEYYIERPMVFQDL